MCMILNALQPKKPITQTINKTIAIAYNTFPNTRQFLPEIIF
jgi:hypothetical protein